jgi:hypothetical protein
MTEPSHREAVSQLVQARLRTAPAPERSVIDTAKRAKVASRPIGFDADRSNAVAQWARREDFGHFDDHGTFVIMTRSTRVDRRSGTHNRQGGHGHGGRD